MKEKNLYYIEKTGDSKPNSHKIVGPTNIEHNKLSDESKKRVCGCFGRFDYAQHWANYYNGLISEESHRVFLL